MEEKIPHPTTRFTLSGPIRTPRREDPTTASVVPSQYLGAVEAGASRSPFATRVERSRREEEYSQMPAAIVGESWQMVRSSRPLSTARIRPGRSWKKERPSPMPAVVVGESIWVGIAIRIVGGQIKCLV